jgi:hypothetical protein
MRDTDEIRQYLDALIEHQASCTVEHCSSCASFWQILELIRRRIFSAVIFPDVMISGHPARSAPDPESASQIKAGRRTQMPKSA